MSKLIEYSLGEIGKYINGKAFKPHEWKVSGIPIIRIANLNNVNAPIDYFQGELEDDYKISDGDILVSWSATLDAFIWNRGPAVLNQHIFKVIPNEKLVNKEFLFFVLKRAMSGLSELVHGATMKHVNKPVFEGFRVSIPKEINDQRKIAQALKSQLAEVVKARKAVERNVKEIKNLLDLIIENEVEFALKSAGQRLKLGQVTSIEAKLVDPKLTTNSSLLHVSAENIESLTGRLINLRSAQEDGMTSGKYKFDNGDVLYSKLRPYLRKVTIVDFDGLCSADMYPLKCDSRLIDTRFLRWLLTSKVFTEYANEKSARSRMPKLNRDQLFDWEFNLPTIKRQTECVKKIEKAIELHAVAFNANRSAQQSIDKLLDKLLEKAFDN